MANAWNYDSLGEDWTEATCAGSNQSPINIVKADAYSAFHDSLRIACALVPQASFGKDVFTKKNFHYIFFNRKVSP